MATKQIPSPEGTITQRLDFDLSRKDYTWMTMEEIREFFNVGRIVYMRIYNWGYARAVRKKGDRNEVVVVEAEANKLIELYKNRAPEVIVEAPAASAIMPPETPAPAPEEKLAALNWKHQAKAAAKVEKLHSLADLAKITPQVSVDAPGFDAVVETAKPINGGDKSPPSVPPPSVPTTSAFDKFPKTLMERQKLNVFMMEYYHIDKNCWRDDWSDDRAANALVMPVHYITNTRKAWFGTGAGNEARAKYNQLILDFTAKLDEHERATKSLRDSLETLKAQLGIK